MTPPGSPPPVSVDDPIARTRNIGIVAHVDAGKTTTTERILFYAGVISRLGEVDDGGAFTDWMEQEQERGISITAAATTFPWAGHQVNLIDTPGHVDFTMEVERCLRVLDGAIAVVSAVEGVQPQTETVWRQADRYHVPRLVFVNKCDRDGAEPEAAVVGLRDRLAAHPVVIQLPIGHGASFEGVIDLITMTARVWDDASLGVRFSDGPPPAEFATAAAAAREAMIEALADVDDGFFAGYASGAADATLPSTIRTALRRATLAGAAVPVLFGAAFRNRGVHDLLDAVVAYLPAPSDLPPITGIVPPAIMAPGAALTGALAAAVVPVHRRPTVDEPLAALAFKVATDEGGKALLTYVRVYAGRLAVGDTVLDATKQRPVAIGQLVRMHANHREEIAELLPGGIGALVTTTAIGDAGLRGPSMVTTGDTLCAIDAPILLDAMHVPQPVIGVAIEPETEDDLARLQAALEALAVEDPSFRVAVDADSGATTIAGMGELHLEILVDRLRREFKVRARVGRMQVAYRETVTQRAQAEHRHWRPAASPGGPAYFGHVVLDVAPAERGLGYRFENRAGAELVPHQYVPAVEEGVNEAVQAGVLAGFPMTDLTVALVGGSFQADDAHPRGYKLAGTRAFRDAALAAAPTVLEPVMELEVRTPDEHTGDVLGDLLARRARVAAMMARPGLQVITAAVPLAEMVGYATALRSTSRGRATYAMQFKHYAVAPQATCDRLARRVSGSGGLGA